MENLIAYFSSFSTETLKAVLKDYLKDLEDIGNAVFKASELRTMGLIKKVTVIREILKERSSK